MDLRRICAQTLNINANTFHLWGIKEVEYQNIHAILEQCRCLSVSIPKIPPHIDPLNSLRGGIRNEIHSR